MTIRSSFFRAFPLWVLSFSLLSAMVVRAQPPLLVVVRVALPTERVLVERLRGQISDLPISLQIDDSPAPEPTGRAVATTADHVWRDHPQAAAAIWFTFVADTFDVFVATRESQTPLVRHVERPLGSLERSAQHEAIALAVRTSLRSLLEARRIVEASALAQAPTAVQPHRTADLKPAQPTHEHLDTISSVDSGSQARSARIATWLGAGTGWSGVSDAVSLSLRGRLSASWRRMRFELRGGLGLPSESRLAFASVQLTRHTTSAHAAWLLFDQAQLQLAAALGGGVAWHRSRVGAEDASLVPHEKGWTELGFLTGDLCLLWMPAWTRALMGLALTAGAMAYVQPLRLGYQTVDLRFAQVARAWPVQPVVSLEVVVPVMR